jgi:hypothetical protein
VPIIAAAMTTVRIAGVDPGGHAQHSTRAGAEVLAGRIRRYWAELDQGVTVRVEPLAAVDRSAAAPRGGLGAVPEAKSTPKAMCCGRPSVSRLSPLPMPVHPLCNHSEAYRRQPAETCQYKANSITKA